MTDARPPHFPPGTYVGNLYLVEGLVRLAEGRMFYLVNDKRPDRDTRKCWSCSYGDTPVDATVCHQCGEAIGPRRFLMSARWDHDRFDAVDAFVRRRFEHPGLITPVDLLRSDDQLLTFVPYQAEGLMVDEASPLSNQRILHLAQRALGTVAWLAQQGVVIGPLRRSNLLIAHDGTLSLYDLDVEDILADAVPAERYEAVIRDLAVLLSSYCHVRASPLVDFLSLAKSGDFPSPPALGRAIEQRFDRYASLAFPQTMSAMSDVGLARQLNEDCWGWTSLDGQAELYVVADGMGGHDGGEVASRMAVDTICRVARDRTLAKTDDGDSIESILNDAFQMANNAIKMEADARGNDMGTTLVAMLLHENRRGYVANVGDSRAYVYRDGNLHQISVDHSFVQRLVERNRITREEARTHPQSNILLRTVGTERDVDIDLFRVELEPGDRVLLCSDGLWGEVEDADIASTLETYSDPRVAARELVRASHQGGGKDNVTLVLVDIPGS